MNVHEYQAKQLLKGFGVPVIVAINRDPSAAIFRLERGPRMRGFGVLFGSEDGARIFAEEIHGMVTNLVIRPFPALLRRFWSGSGVGLSVVAERAVVVLDPERLPESLVGSLAKSVAPSPAS